MWATLLLAAALPAPALAATASETAERARVVYEEAMAAKDVGQALIKDLAAMRTRYGSDMDVVAMTRERADLLARLDEVSLRYATRRSELQQLRKDHQSGQLVRLLGRAPKDQFAAGLMETLEFNRFMADINGYPRLLEDALREDKAAFEAAVSEAGKARTLRLILIGVGAVALLFVILLAALPRRTAVRRLE